MSQINIIGSSLLINFPRSIFICFIKRQSFIYLLNKRNIILIFIYICYYT